MDELKLIGRIEGLRRTIFNRKTQAWFNVTDKENNKFRVFLNEDVFNPSDLMNDDEVVVYGFPKKTKDGRDYVVASKIGKNCENTDTPRVPIVGDADAKQKEIRLMNCLNAASRVAPDDCSPIALANYARELYAAMYKEN